MTRTATAAPAKITATAKAAGAKAKPTVRNEEQTTIDRLMQDYLNAQRALLAAMKAPTWKRLLAAAVVTLAIGAGVGWICGFAIEFLTLGAVALTNSAYAGLVVWFFGVLFTLAAAAKLGAMGWDAVMSGRVEEFAAPKIAGVKNWIAGKFAFGSRVVVA